LFQFPVGDPTLRQMMQTNGPAPRASAKWGRRWRVHSGGSIAAALKDMWAADIAVSRWLLILPDAAIATASIDILVNEFHGIPPKKRARKSRVPPVAGIFAAVRKKKSMGRPVKFFEMDAGVWRMDVRVSSMLIPKFVSLRGILVYELRNRKDTSKSLFQVWRFRNPHDELAAIMMRTSEPPH
jgi:hypothetical protein